MLGQRSRGGFKVAGGGADIEPWHWLNVLVGWVCEGRRLVPEEWLGAWLHELNDQARKQSVRFNLDSQVTKHLLAAYGGAITARWAGGWAGVRKRDERTNLDRIMKFGS